MEISELPPKLRKEAEAERARQIKKNRFGNPGGTKLIQYFFWHESKRGYKFWKSVNEGKYKP